MLWQGSPPFQVGLDLNCVLPKGTLNLLVEVGVAVIDEVNIFVCMVLAPSAVCVTLVLPASRTECGSLIQSQHSCKGVVLEARVRTPWISALTYGSDIVIALLCIKANDGSSEHESALQHCQLILLCVLTSRY